MAETAGQETTLEPTLSDLPEEQQLKAKALMLGAVAGLSGSKGKIEILRDEGSEDGKEGENHRPECADQN
jgi:hypothetical protein